MIALSSAETPLDLVRHRLTMVPDFVSIGWTFVSADHLRIDGTIIGRRLLQETVRAMLAGAGEDVANGDLASLAQRLRAIDRCLTEWIEAATSKRARSEFLAALTLVSQAQGIVAVLTWQAEQAEVVA